MNNPLWNAMLCSSSPRYRDWHDILGTDEVPLVDARPRCGTLGGEKDVSVYLLDWKQLASEQKIRLCSFLAVSFGARQDEIYADLDRLGVFPIREEDVMIAYSLRAFL